MYIKCDICKQTRPDESISVHKVDIGPPEFPGIVVRNVKYCNDNSTCLQGALDWKKAA